MKHQRTNVVKRKKRSLKSLAFALLCIIIFLTAGFISVKLTTIIIQKDPYISPIPQMIAGIKKSVKSSQTTKLEELLQKNNIDFKTVSIASNSSYLVELKDGEHVLYSSQKDLSSQVATLQLILRRLTIEGKKFSRLDLRFDKPVIVLK